MNTTYLLLGSNEGDRKSWLDQAKQRITDICGAIIEASGIYETAAWGLEQQPDFFNQVIQVETKYTAEELLACIQEIELQLGRQRKVKWGQRTLDIDILFFNDEIWDLPHLKIPHPFLAERRFTLVPLAEIAASLIHPVYNRSIGELLADCADPLPAIKTDTATHHKTK